MGDAEVREWTDALARATAAPGFAAERARAGLLPHTSAGAKLRSFIERSMTDYRALAADFGLVRP